MRVLVVEDDDAIRTLTAQILRHRGHEVTEAPDGQQAWHRWQEAAFPLIVVDWMLPHMDGLALCRRIRASPGGDDAVIIVSTGRDRPEDIQAVLEAGANDYIAKPFTLSLLRVRLAVAERQVEQALLQQETEAHLAYQALHDSLTGLPNRSLLMDRLRQAILSARRQGTTVALLMMDLDRFKEVNDTFGHYVGDLLLKHVGVQLQDALRASDTVARLGGDEFAAILPIADEAGAVLAATKLLTLLDNPLIVEGQALDVHGSVGIALCPEHGDDAEELLRQADVAMYVAKRAQSGFAVYHPESDQHTPGRYALRGELRQAIDREELVLHYQPKLSFNTGSIVRVEALVRWQHPRHGLLFPDDFIPLAEQSGLIEPLSHWVLDTALRQVHDWKAAGFLIPTSVNLSMRNLGNQRLPEIVAGLLETWNVPPAWLILEITESSIMFSPERSLEVLARLSALGVQIAIDDFGTGYSSLTYLRNMPVDLIKIDKSFVTPMARNPDDYAIVRSTIELGHHFGVPVVAEGVEDQITLDLLTELGCDGAQGFFLAQPMPPIELEQWLAVAPWKLASTLTSFLPDGSNASDEKSRSQRLSVHRLKHDFAPRTPPAPVDAR